MKFLASITALVLFFSTAAHAAGQHSHADKPLHGGVVAEARDMDFELVAQKDKLRLYGQRSRESLDELVAGRTVIVETTKKDRYGRFVGKVLVNGRDINIEEIRRGMAWFYRHYEKELPDSDRQSYDRAEVEAKDYRRGLWADRSPTPPWEFRQTKRGQ